MHIKDWLEAINYKITEGSEYYPVFKNEKNYFLLESWDGDQEGVTSSIVFDTYDQRVIRVELHLFSKMEAYLWIDPDIYLLEDVYSEAWDGVEFELVDTSVNLLNMIKEHCNG